MLKTFAALFLILQVTISCSKKIPQQNTIPANNLTSQADSRQVILKESETGGKLDYFSPIKGHETDGIQIKPGVYDTKLGLALYKWGRANQEVGIKSIEEVYSIYSEFRNRPVNEIEKVYLKMGYGRELEK